MKHYQFTDPLVLHVHGPDARRYLNARLSNSIDSVSSTSAIPSAILNAQGKTEGYFFVLEAPEGYLLYCSGGAHEQVIGAFKRFLVADRLSVTMLPDCTLRHLIASQDEILSLFPDAVPTTRFGTSQSEGHTLIRTDRTGQTGFDVLCTKPELETDLSAKVSKTESTPLSENQFEVLRIQFGEPSFPQELNESSIFSESELHHSVSFSKGCYVGQEALEMLAARGKLPARVARVQSNQCIIPGETIYEDESKKIRIGSILSAVADEDSKTYFGFARVKTAKIDLPQIFTESGAPCSLKLRSTVTLHTIP